MIPVLRIGTRGSALALAQCGHVARFLEAAGVCERAELVTIVTTGDRITDRSLALEGGKGLFIKELEEALLDGRVDCAVHSLKDMPAELLPEFFLGTILPREDARDVLFGATSVAALPQGAVVGTSSLRRGAQLLYRRRDLRVVTLRGNVGTRLAKLADPTSGIDATLLAAAGLARLGLEHSGAPLDPSEMLPAVGQGTLAVECLAARESLAAHLAAVAHRDTEVRASAERAFLAALGGSCTTPVAAYAEAVSSGIRLRALIAHPDGSAVVAGERLALGADAARAGADLARELLAGGGRALLGL
jgi:hydroxymethylbilane synthase